KGYILIDKAQIKNEDELYTISLDAGADDVQVGEKNYEIFSDPKDFEQLKEALKAKNIKMEEAEITMVPSSKVKVTAASDAKQLLSLIEALEEQEDVQKVHANFDISDELLEQIAAEMP
ncbi:MAG: YebC/PmpR family DNA-binding transcriptional regulator, partial [Candidatus Omnitrophica bacterium]|nr:YebC/PmpR family DNA-binding transcriptional regulator [Candidatus Omnitrophota bacterium]